MSRFARRTVPAIIAAVLLAGPVVVAAPAVLAQKSPVYTGWFGNVAVGGFDPVAYFTQGRPVEGDRRFTAEHQGATFRFASAANRDAFLANPAAYAPQYGGYCAWAVAQGYTAKGDPQNWRIVDGKLYLNYDASVQRQWEADIPGFIRKGDANWPRVLN